MEKISTGPYDAQRQASEMLAWALMTALPTGILGRLGLEAMRTVHKGPKDTGITPTGYKIPLHIPRTPKEEEKEASEASKGGFKVNEVLHKLHKGLADAIHGTLAGDSWLGGGMAKSPHNVPWAWGLGIPATGLALSGGFAGTDKLITKLRHKEKEQETTAAQKEYERLLRLAVEEARPKNASALDALSVIRTKEGQYASPWYTPSGAGERAADYGGGGLGLLLAAMLLTGGFTGKHMWDKTKSRTKHDLVEEARRIRSMRDTSPGFAMYVSDEDDHI